MTTPGTETEWVLVPRAELNTLGFLLRLDSRSKAQNAWGEKIAAWLAASPTASAPDARGGGDQVERAARYVIRRHGAFFRPNAAGYTHHIAAAGFYSKAEAERYLDAEGVSIHPMADYRAEIDAALKGADRLRAALSEQDKPA